MKNIKALAAGGVGFVILLGIVFLSNINSDSGTSKYVVVVPLTQKFANSFSQCKSYKRTYTNPNGGVAGVYKQTIEIKGWQNKKCVVKYEIKHSLAHSDGAVTCLFPAGTVKKLGKMYNDIINDKYVIPENAQGFFAALNEVRSVPMNRSEQINEILNETWDSTTQQYCE